MEQKYEIYSDYELGYEWHVQKMTDGIALCDLMGLEVLWIGIMGSVRAVCVEKLGKILQFNQPKKNYSRWVLDFDPTPYGIEARYSPGEGWVFEL